jgi:hypothetical protein
MKLIKLKKQEREKMIESILDYALDNACMLDVVAELRMYLKSGIPSGVIPYKEKTDEALIMDFLKTFDLLDLLDGDERDERFIRSQFSEITDYSKTRTDKIIKYLKQK